MPPRPLVAAAPAVLSASSPTTGGAWPEILTSVGFRAAPASQAGIFVRAPGRGSAEWPARVENGAFLILEGESSLGGSVRFPQDAAKTSGSPASPTCIARNCPSSGKAAQEMPRFEVPPRPGSSPRSAGPARRSSPVCAAAAGAVLWVAASPGEHGYERFPYLLHALADLGLDPPFRSARLWAFFDSSYRSRVDLDYFAAALARGRHRRAACRRLAFLRSRRPRAMPTCAELIAACHRQGILVYAWFELPHVSEKFWDDHPQWREQTAVQQDAQLDWRKLMNLQNRDCFRAVAARRAGAARPLRLGWSQPGRALLRIARGRCQPRAFHAHESGRSRRNSRQLHARSRSTFSRPPR